MTAARTVLIIAVCVLAIAGTVMLNQDGAVTDDERLVGQWIGAELTLRLDDDGRYQLVLGTSGSPRVECGKWRALDGSVQMRMKGRRGGSTALWPYASGFHSGEYRFDPAAQTTALVLAMQTSVATSTGAQRWDLRRTEATGPLACP